MKILSSKKSFVNIWFGLFGCLKIKTAKSFDLSMVILLNTDFFFKLIQGSAGPWIFAGLIVDNM